MKEGDFPKVIKKYIYINIFDRYMHDFNRDKHIMDIALLFLQILCNVFFALFLLEILSFSDRCRGTSLVFAILTLCLVYCGNIFFATVVLFLVHMTCIFLKMGLCNLQVYHHEDEDTVVDTDEDEDVNEDTDEDEDKDEDVNEDTDVDTDEDVDEDKDVDEDVNADPLIDKIDEVRTLIKNGDQSRIDIALQELQELLEEWAK